MHGDEGMVKAFTAFCYVAKEEMANCKVTSLLRLLELLGCSELATFQHRIKGSMQEIFETIGNTILDRITQEIASTNSVGIPCDDVADVATLEQMITWSGCY